MHLLKVTPDDVSRLQEIAIKTFRDTFSSTNENEDMEQYIAAKFSIEQLKNELTHPHSEFYFALVNEEVKGFLKINFLDAQTELKEKQGMEVERIYVLKEFHGKDVGKFLLKNAIAVALEKNKSYVWLGVHEENVRAVKFYEKHGFKTFGTHLFMLGNSRQIDLLMKLILS